MYTRKKYSAKSVFHSSKAKPSACKCTIAVTALPSLTLQPHSYWPECGLTNSVRTFLRQEC